MIQMVLVAAGVMSAAPAFAQDASAPSAPAQDATAQAAPAPDAPPPSTSDGIDPTFTGPRIEGFGGVDFQKNSFRPEPAGTERNHTGGVAGALGGFDLGFRNVVVGVFGSYALPTSNFCAPRPAGAAGGCVRPEREVEAGGRIGFKAGDSFLGLGNRALFYAKGAYVNTSVKTQSTFTGGGTYNTYRLIGGWRAGGGIEYALTNHAYIKAEYDYTRTGRFSLQPYGVANTEYRLSKNQVLGGFGIRF